jgi:hypothetical protein
MVNANPRLNCYLMFAPAKVSRAIGLELPLLKGEAKR